MVPWPWSSSRSESLSPHLSFWLKTEIFVNFKSVKTKCDGNTEQNVTGALHVSFDRN